MKTLSILRFALSPLLLIGLIQLSACQADVPDPIPDPEPDPYEAHVLVGQAQDGNISIDVYADEALYAGYNTLYIKVMEGDIETKKADVMLKPMMDMTTMVHSCPVEQPQLNDDNLIEAHVLFQMPSMGGAWELNINVKMEDGAEHDFNMPIEVVQPEFTRAIVSTVEGKKLILGYVDPMEPKVGENDFEVAIYTMKDMMTFEPVEGLSIKMEPEMPSMGHGSFGNIDPIETVNGHYKGTVVFNMVGDWRIHMEVQEKGVVIKDGIYFDLYFQ